MHSKATGSSCKNCILASGKKSRSHKSSFQTADISLIFPSFYILFNRLMLLVFFLERPSIPSWDHFGAACMVMHCAALFLKAFYFSSCGFFFISIFFLFGFFCLLPFHSANSFALIKRVAYISMSVMTECIRYESTISVMNVCSRAFNFTHLFTFCVCACVHVSVCVGYFVRADTTWCIWLLKINWRSKWLYYLL